MDGTWWNRSGAKKVPAIVKQAIVSQFHLDPEAIAGLRMLGKTGQLAALAGTPASGQPVRFIRIYDAAQLASLGCGRPAYDELKTPALRAALRFEGHIDHEGIVHLADRRAPRLSYRPINLDRTHSSGLNE
jgi:hypothetical protein